MAITTLREKASSPSTNNMGLATEGLPEKLSKEKEMHVQSS